MLKPFPSGFQSFESMFGISELRNGNSDEGGLVYSTGSKCGCCGLITTLT